MGLERNEISVSLRAESENADPAWSFHWANYHPNESVLQNHPKAKKAAKAVENRKGESFFESKRMIFSILDMMF